MECLQRRSRGSHTCMQYAYERPRLESVAQGNIFLSSLRKIHLYLIRLDGGVERDCSTPLFPSVRLVPPPEVEGEGPAPSSIMVEIERNNALSCMRKINTKSILLKVSIRS